MAFKDGRLFLSPERTTWSQSEYGHAVKIITPPNPNPQNDAFLSFQVVLLTNR